MGICKVCGKQYKQSINEGYCSSNCVTLEKNRLIILDIPENISELGRSILELKNKGTSNKVIAKELNCSTSTVSYYCSSKTKDTVKKYREEFKEDQTNVFKLIKAVQEFKGRKKGSGRTFKNNDWNKKLRSAVSGFKNKQKLNYTYKDALEHLGGINTKCYLTGKEINIETDDFNLDHIIPKTQGGTNELSNMGITTPLANMSKTGMNVEEYIELCKEVLINFGYTISK